MQFPIALRAYIGQTTLSQVTHLDWLQKISITCFAASYGVVFALEVSRMFFQTTLRTILRLGLTAAGLFAHTAYIIYHTQSTVGSDGIWLGSWLGWGLAVAWVLAASYLCLLYTSPSPRDS